MGIVRVIARMDIKGTKLVKGIHLEGLRVLGKPEEFALHYYESGIDELIYQDVVASLYGRNSLCEMVSRTAREIYIPLTVGGGIRSLADISSVLAAGADKVSINTAAIHNPDLIRQASRTFGSSTIVVAIEAIRERDGQYLIYTDNGREHTGIDAIEWAIRAEELGAGEIIATSVDQEGTGTGYDLDLTRKIAEAVSIPVIAHGGPGKLEHISDVVISSGVDAVAIGGMLHYDAIRKLSGSVQNNDEGNHEFLRSKREVTHMTPATIGEVKTHLMSSSIECRMEVAL
ncbi:MAG TPA: imidazole glycerol phosphate synthase cyclase subunit [Planctomycetaceae bacterium]|nr:imidazole glycerol phosphate synthase cyclase subunit [Planctomycetaceae bacterium]HQZ63632.1 imidazole glycerol phosphate synthase cyclase subunit [Planctomycetaceae bacterium]